MEIEDNCEVKSLVLKETGEECILKNVKMPFFLLEQERPYNNEIKLIHPNKKTVFNANRIRREGNNLIVGFDLIRFEAVVEIKEEDSYISFLLKDFIMKISKHNKK